MTTTDNLSEKGLSFFLDRELKHELVQDAIVNMKSGESIEFFVSSRYTTGAEHRIGKVFILEEEFKSLLFDAIKEVGGQTFRSYNAIESIELDVEFDAHEFTRDLLLSKKSHQLYNVLELLTRGITKGFSAYKTCVYKQTNRIIPCDESGARPIFEPRGGWEAVDEYNFYKDFFITAKDGGESLWNQWRATPEVRNAIGRYYIDHGFEKSVKNPTFTSSYNYYNNIYPEQTRLLNYRWHEGGYTITPHEVKLNKTFIYGTLKGWYRGRDQEFGQPLVPELRNNDDWKLDMWSSSNCCAADNYVIYNGKMSTVPGQDELVFNSERSGYIGIRFPAPIKVDKMTVNVGIHAYSNNDTPAYIRIYARNEGGDWIKIKEHWNWYVTSDGSVTTIDLPGTTMYEYYRFNWYNTHGGSYTRISNMQWYGTFHSQKDFNYDADEKTVKYFTDIAKTELYELFKKDEYILVDLLGPPQCVQWDTHETCTRVAYGGVTSQPAPGTPWDLPSDIVNTALDGDLSENSFLVVRPSTFTAISYDMVISPNFRSQIYNTGLTGEDAFYAVFYFNGIIGGQHIYNNAIGNEYRYAMQFDTFLDEQGWTIDDFMYIYRDHVREFIEGLYTSMKTNSYIRAKDYCEFYDINHRSPFDGIKVYIPKVPIVQIPGYQKGKVEVNKKKATYDVHGNVLIEDVPPIVVDHGDIDIPLNKDEYVHSVKADNSMRVIMSDFMRIKVKMTLQNSFNNEDNIRFRVSTNDFTYLSVRDFLHV